MGAGGQYLVQRHCHLLPGEIVDSQSHRARCVELEGNHGATVEWVRVVLVQGKCLGLGVHRLHGGGATL